MITIHNLTVSYNGHPKVLDALCLSLATNKIHGIVGLNGAGKTTLLNALCRLVRIDGGHISNEGRNLTRIDLSYLTTENFFYSNITAREYLGLFKNPRFNPDRWNGLFGLPLDQVTDGYSSGMKKKLALLGILKQDKPIMILDEPFNGLDLETCRIVRSILLSLKDNGKTIIVTSHILETLTNLCDAIHYLENGTIKYSKGKNDFQEFEQEIFQSIELKNNGLISELTRL